MIALLVVIGVIATQATINEQAPWRRYSVAPQSVRGKVSAFGKAISVGRQELESREEFYRRLRKEAGGVATFAGKYSIVVWSCGSGCGAYAIVNTVNGEIYEIPFGINLFTPDRGDRVVFRLDSRLIVVRGLLEMDEHGAWLKIPRKCNPCYYVWTQGALKTVDH